MSHGELFGDNASYVSWGGHTPEDIYYGLNPR